MKIPFEKKKKENKKEEKKTKKLTNVFHNKLRSYKQFDQKRGLAIYSMMGENELESESCHELHGYVWVFLLSLTV